MEDIIHALESLAAVDWPREWAHMDAEFALYLVHQIKWVFTLTVHLIDEDHHRGLAHTADLHEATGLCLHTFGGVNNDDY